MTINNKLRDEIAEKYRAVEELSNLLDEVREDAQATFDKRSEKWQDGEKGQEVQSDIEELEEMISELQDVTKRVDEFFEAND